MRSGLKLQPHDSRLVIQFDFFFYLFPELDNVVSSKCSIQINGQTVEKAVGEVWSSAQDVCMKHACELAENGTAREISFQEYCFQTCYNVS